jgi:hypothetical protein
MLEVLAGWENPSQRLVPAREGRPTRLYRGRGVYVQRRPERWGWSTYLANTSSRAEFYTDSRRRLPCRWRILLWVGFRVARGAEPCAWFKMQGL